MKKKEPEKLDSLLKELEKFKKPKQYKRETAKKIEAYLKRLEMQCECDFESRRIPGAAELTLEDLYVELQAERLHRPKERPEEAVRDSSCVPDEELKNRAGFIRGKLDDFLTSEISLRWTLQGEPGSGKTTLLLKICDDMIKEARRIIRKGDTKELQERLVIPAYVSIGAWRRSRTELLEYLDQEFSELGVRGAGEILRTEADAGRVVWLFDGLDEVDPQDTLSAVKRIAIHVKTFDQCKAVMTSRIFGYKKPPGAGFKELKLLPLEGENRFNLLKNHLKGERPAEEVLDEIDRNRTLKELAGNPFFLTMIAVAALKKKNKKQYEPLPVRRSELLKKVIDELLSGGPGPRPEGPFPNRPLAQRLLEDLALELMRNFTPPYEAFDVNERLMIIDNRKHEDSRLLPEAYRNDPSRFISSIANHNYLMTFHGESRKYCRFLHRSVQEYLAACSLKRMDEPTWKKIAESLLPEKRDKISSSNLGRWAEVFGYLAGEMKNPNELLEKLMKINSDLGLRALSTADNVTGDTLAAMMGLVKGGDKWQARREIIESIPDQLGYTETAVDLLDKIRRETKPTNGADLFFISGTYDLIRKKTDDNAVKRHALIHKEKIFHHLDEPQPDFLKTIVIKGKEHEYWSRIPAGNFLMGSPKDEEGRYDDEPENLPVSLSEFHMGKVPVTNRDYELFDPSHKDDRAFGDKETEMHPAVNVTWYEAIMFSRWATEILKRRGDLDDGEIITLPSEAQWEYACRAGKKTMFWSGDKEEDLDRVGWYDGNSGGRTHAVGEKSANPRGLFDMHGNVDEWCLDEWSDKYKETGNDPVVGNVQNISAGRSIRGGSWFNDPRNCRSAFRFDWDPGDRSDDQGFRVVRVRRGPQV